MEEFQFGGVGPTLRVVVLAFLFVFALAALALVVVLAAMPGKIARSRQHPQADAVNICGWLGLPTGAQWVLAMVWAFYRHDRLVAPADGKSTADISAAPLARRVAELETAITQLESSLNAKTR